MVVTAAAQPERSGWSYQFGELSSSWEIESPIVDGVAFSHVPSTPTAQVPSTPRSQPLTAKRLAESATPHDEKHRTAQRCPGI